jgi:hypothetical protein
MGASFIRRKNNKHERNSSLDLDDELMRYARGLEVPRDGLGDKGYAVAQRMLEGLFGKRD